MKRRISLWFLLSFALLASLVGCSVDEASYSNVQLIDETGTPYGVQHIDNKPRVSAMPYLFDIAEGNIANHTLIDKFGRNTAIGGSLEEIWESAILYPYLSTSEVLQVSSNDVDDQGNVLSSGVLTSGSSTVVTDLGATFQTDTVAAGDIFLNDTMITALGRPDSVAHGIIKSVDSETQLTLEIATEISSTVGDVYRVVEANDTGAAVIQIGGQDGNYIEIAEYVILATGASVATVKSYLRVYRVIVRLGGASFSNEGIISIKDNADVVTLAVISATFGQTMMALWTVPAGMTLYVTNYYASEVNAKTTLFVLMVRPFGEKWQIKHSVEIKNSKFQHFFDTPRAFVEKTDIAVFAATTGAGGEGSAGFGGWYEE